MPEICIRIQKDIEGLLEARWPTSGSSYCYVNHYLPSQSIELSSFHLKILTVFASTMYFLILFYSSTTLCVNHFLLISFLNLNLSNLYNFLRVPGMVFRINTLSKSSLIISLINLKFQINILTEFVFLQNAS